MKSLKLYFTLALLLCLAPMPYGYYMLVRIVAAILFVIFAGQYYAAKKDWPSLLVYWLSFFNH